MTISTPHPAEAADRDVLSAEAGAALLRRAPWHRMAVFGDSLSLGIGDPTPGYQDLGWAERVERTLRMVHPDLEFITTARVGATTAEAIQEQTTRIEEFGPDLLHVNSGANDIIRRTPDWSRIESDLRAMYEWAHGTGAQVSVFTLGRAFMIPAFPDFGQRVIRLNHITRTLAAEYGAVVAECWDHPLNDRSDLVSADGIHFARTGHAVIASILIDALSARIPAGPA